MPNNDRRLIDRLRKRSEASFENRAQQLAEIGLSRVVDQEQVTDPEHILNERIEQLLEIMIVNNDYRNKLHRRRSDMQALPSVTETQRHASNGATEYGLTTPLLNSQTEYYAEGTIVRGWRLQFLTYATNFQTNGRDSNYTPDYKHRLASSFVILDTAHYRAGYLPEERAVHALFLFNPDGITGCRVDNCPDGAAALSIALSDADIEPGNTPPLIDETLALVNEGIRVLSGGRLN